MKNLDRYSTSNQIEMNTLFKIFNKLSLLDKRDYNTSFLRGRDIQ